MLSCSQQNCHSASSTFRDVLPASVVTVNSSVLKPRRSAVPGLILLFLAALCASPFARAQVTTLVPQGSVWKFVDNGANLGTAWRNASYDDGSWRTGRAQLGYGDGDEATVIGFGPNTAQRYLTAYFRHTFQVANPAALGSLQLQLLRDDGAVVYLNGVEVFRSNMPAGTVGSSTPASSVTTGTGETVFIPATISPAFLLAGSNTLAVELHQSDTASIDASFDLLLKADPGPAVNRGPYLQMLSPDSVVIRWRTTRSTDTVVRYGIDPSHLSETASSATKSIEHEIRVQGLVPDSRYYYAVGTSVGNLSGPRDDQYFVSAPVSGTSRTTRIWAVGDSGKANASLRAVRDAYFGVTGARSTDLMLMLGDNAYESGLDTEYQAAVFDMFPTLLRSTSLSATLGNHDVGTSIPSAQTGPYFTSFSLPTQGESGGLASGTEAYYSFDYANIHFISLNSSGSTDRSAAWSNDGVATGGSCNHAAAVDHCVLASPALTARALTILT